MKLRGVVVVLAVSGSLSGAWACGAATGVGIFDDAGGQDATLDSSGDVVLVDVGGDSSSCPMASDLGSQRPSCAPGGAGMTNCGPGGSGTESCCTSPEVCGGTYYRTYANDGGPAAEADPAIVSDFRT